MTEEKLAARLAEAGAPPARAQEKAADSAIGWVLVLIGTVSLGAGSAIAILLARAGSPIGMWLVGLIALFVMVAFTFVAIGMHLLARDAAPKAIQQITDTLVSLIRAIRGNGPSA